MKRILLTGAQGFTGIVLASQLRARGYFVHGIGAKALGGLPDYLDAYDQVDIRDLASLRVKVRSVSPDGIIHLAAISFVGHENVHDIYDTNVIATRNLLVAASEAVRKPQSVILASSANVYGNSREGALNENTPYHPANDYAVSKAAMELVASLFVERLPIIISRPFNYIGRGQSANFLVAKIADHARRKAPFIELGNIDVARDFSDVRTVAECYVRLLETPAAIGKTVNICSGRSFTLREMLEKIEQLSAHKMEIRINPQLVRENDVKMMRGDPSLLHSLIGRVENPPIEETLGWILEG